jgi:hypothetical protein
VSGFCKVRILPHHKTLKEKIEERIARKASDAVSLTREFANLAGEDQVLHVAQHRSLTPFESTTSIDCLADRRT